MVSYKSTKPNNRTVWLMFALGAIIGVGFTYVIIDPDQIIQSIADNVCTNYIMPKNIPSETYESIVNDIDDLLILPNE